MPSCRYCGASIRWVELTTGKRMPLNLDPDPNGNVVMIEGKGAVLTGAELLARRGTGGRYMPHQATCTGRPRRNRGGAPRAT